MEQVTRDLGETVEAFLWLSDHLHKQRRCRHQCAVRVAGRGPADGGLYRL